MILKFESGIKAMFDMEEISCFLETLQKCTRESGRRVNECSFLSFPIFFPVIMKLYQSKKVPQNTYLKRKLAGGLLVPS